MPLLLRAGFCLGLMCVLEAQVWGDDPEIPSPQAPAAAPRRAVQGAQYPSPAPMAPISPRGPYWAPGGDMYSGTRIGSPYYWSAPGAYGYSAPYGGGYGAGWPAPAGYGVGFGYGLGYGGAYSGAGVDPYTYHFGPGFHRSADQAHYRFPYYSYRQPWYTPGPPSYNRDTNFPW